MPSGTIWGSVSQKHTDCIAFGTEPKWSQYLLSNTQNYEIISEILKSCYVFVHHQPSSFIAAWAHQPPECRVSAIGGNKFSVYPEAMHLFYTVQCNLFISGSNLPQTSIFLPFFYIRWLYFNYKEQCNCLFFKLNLIFPLSKKLWRCWSATYIFSVIVPQVVQCRVSQHRRREGTHPNHFLCICSLCVWDCNEWKYVSMKFPNESYLFLTMTVSEQKNIMVLQSAGAYTVGLCIFVVS